MIALPTGTQLWIAAGVTDLRRGFTGLSATIQTALKENPFSGHVFVFRGRRGDLIKLLWQLLILKLKGSGIPVLPPHSSLQHLVTNRGSWSNHYQIVIPSAHRTSFYKCARSFLFSMTVLAA
jgi:hypothetical protein